MAILIFCQFVFIQKDFGKIIGNPIFFVSYWLKQAKQAKKLESNMVLIFIY